MATLHYNKVKETYIAGVHKYHFEVDCARHHGVQVISVDGEALHRYHNGEGHLQDLFPDLTPGQREILFQSNYCDKCWEELFGTDEEES